MKQGVNISNLQNLLLAIPPLSEQRISVSLLDDVDLKIHKEAKRKSALESLFNSLLHHLMTGKIRVGAGHSPNQPEDMASSPFQDII